ncbi:MAG: M48 family metalloprotease [Acidobacteria bacterium]|nr:M48 family metalloprotease [Acidobacteriota bacterium]
MTHKLPALLLVVATAVACVTNPATGQRQFNLLSEQDEVALGKQADAQVRQEMGLYPDQGWQDYVNRVGQALAKTSHRPQLPWTFAVVDAQAINAFALPGGYIYLTRGILPFLHDEAEMANVLGHEIAHVTALHGATAYSRQQAAGLGIGIGRILAPPDQQGWFTAAEASLGLLFLKHGRDAELEADRLGVGYAATSGWNPSGMAGMLSTLGRLSEASGSSRGVPNFLSTHPLPADRVEQVSTVADAARTSSATRVNEAEFNRRLDGLVFGDSREQGMVRGRNFLHPILRIALRFPQGWQVNNGAQQVAAMPEAENQQRVLLLEVVESGGRSPAQAGRARMQEAQLIERAGENVTINGLQAFVGVFSGGTGNEAIVARVAFISHGGRLYQVAGVASQNAFSQADPDFRETIGSFRGLSAAEADRVQPARLDFYTARSGDTWESLAKRSDGTVSASALAIMNGAQPSSRPAVGARVRVVIGG